MSTTESAGASKIRILLADDHALFRHGVASVLNQENDLVVVGEAENGAKALELYRRLQPDVALLDLSMPGMSGVQLVQRLRSEHPEARLIILTTYETDEDIERVLSAGAQAYLLKDVAADELAVAIRDVCAGRMRVAPSVAAKLAQRFTRVHLTMRELEILRRVAEGKSNKEIADLLHVTDGTVKVHLSNLFEKLNVTSRTEAVAAGIRRGLVRIPG